MMFEVLPELAPMQGFAQNNPYHDCDVWSHTIKVIEHIPPHPYLRWAALLHDSGKPRCYSEQDGQGHFFGHARISGEIAEVILSRLKFDTKTAEKILLLVRMHDRPLIPEAPQMKRLLNQIGEENLRDLLLVCRADTAGHSADCRDARLAELAAYEYGLDRMIAARPVFTLKQLAVNGDDLLAAGYRPGKEIGTALQFLLDAVIDGKCENNKAALLRYCADN
jgi:tRNA nucleotidyltransferase (CCA-adding enzyme)